MPIDAHCLSAEFPELKDAIHALKHSSTHFAKLFDEYNNADHLIARVENGVEHMGDMALENLKKVRLALKDQLYQALQARI